MAKSWKEVEQSETFQSLPAQEKVKAQQQYFDQVVAPQAGDGVDMARQQFFNTYNYYQKEEPSLMSKVSDWITGDDRVTDDIAGLEEIGNAPELNEMSWGAVKSSLGLMATGNEDKEQQIIKANYPDAKFRQDSKGNRIVSLPSGEYVLNKPGISGHDVIGGAFDLLASTPAGRAGTVAATAGRSAVTEAALQGTQAGTGADVDLQDAAGDIAITGALGGVAKGAEDLIMSGARRLSESAADRARAATREAEQAEIGRLSSELSPEQQLAQQTEMARNVAQQARARRPDLERVAGDVMPDEEIRQAASRIGVSDSLTPAQTSSSQTYRELEGALAAVPASKLSAMQRQGIDATAQKADDFIEEFGGTLDKSSLSESLRDDVLRTIDDLDKKSSDIYSNISKQVDPQMKVDSSNIYAAIKQKAEDLGGDEFLDPIEKRALKIAESNPSYSLIDNERKKIGNALRKSKGPYKDADTGALKRLYGLFTGAQEGAAEQAGVSDMWDVAKRLTAQRKQLEDQSINLLGKNKTAAIMPKVGQALKKLAPGDYKAFDETIASIPKERRGEVIISALNDVFTGGSRKEKQLNPAAFTDWYEALSRNSAAKRRLNANLPDGARERLRDLYLVSKGIRNASSERVRTGVIQGLLKDFDSESGLISKLYQVGKGAAAAEGVTTSIGVPGVGTASAIASALSKGKADPIANAADDLISSPEFSKLVKSYAGNSTKAKAAQAKAERELARSEKYQKWFDRLPSEERRKIIRTGIIGYLSNETDKTEQETQQ